MIGTVLLHGDGAFKGSVTHCQSDALTGRLLDQLANLVRVIACYHLTIDLQDKERVSIHCMGKWEKLATRIVSILELIGVLQTRNVSGHVALSCMCRDM